MQAEDLSDISIFFRVFYLLTPSLSSTPTGAKSPRGRHELDMTITIRRDTPLPVALQPLQLPATIFIHHRLKQISIQVAEVALPGGVSRDDEEDLRCHEPHLGDQEIELETVDLLEIEQRPDPN